MLFSIRALFFYWQKKKSFFPAEQRIITVFFSTSEIPFVPLSSSQAAASGLQHPPCQAGGCSSEVPALVQGYFESFRPKFGLHRYIHTASKF